MKKLSLVITPFVIAGFVLFAAAANAKAQPGTNIGDVTDTAAGPISLAIEQRNRELSLRSVQLTSRTVIRPDTRAGRAMLQKLNEDFKQLQIVRLGMVRDITAGKQFEMDRLALDSSDIRKRAARLQSSLALIERNDSDRPEPEKVRYDRTTIQDAASDLCLEVSKFTGNPMFRPNSVYNARNAAEAEKTLDAVIKLAADIKNSAADLKGKY